MSLLIPVFAMPIHENDLLSRLPSGNGSPSTNWMPTPLLIERLHAVGFDIRYNKQITRKLQALETEGLILSRKNGRVLEWQRKEGVSGFTKGFMPLEEAMALQLLRRFSSRRLPRQAEGSLQALFAAAEDRLRQTGSMAESHYASWHRKIDVYGSAFQLHSPRIHDEVFRTVLDALFTEQLLTLKYQRPNQPRPARATLLVMPLGLVEIDELLYLIARTQSGDSFIPNPTMYRLDRLKQAQLTTERFDYPRDFVLNDYIRKEKKMEFFVGDRIQVVLRTSRGLGERLRETALHPRQTITEHPDGTMTVEASVVLSLRFTQWLLGQGHEAQVLQPASLRQYLKSEISRMHKLYR